MDAVARGWQGHSSPSPRQGHSLSPHHARPEFSDAMKSSSVISGLPCRDHEARVSFPDPGGLPPRELRNCRRHSSHTQSISRRPALNVRRRVTGKVRCAMRSRRAKHRLGVGGGVRINTLSSNGTTKPPDPLCVRQENRSCEHHDPVRESKLRLCAKHTTGRDERAGFLPTVRPLLCPTFSHGPKLPTSSKGTHRASGSCQKRTSRTCCVQDANCGPSPPNLRGVY